MLLIWAFTVLKGEGLEQTFPETAIVFDTKGRNNEVGVGKCDFLSLIFTSILEEAT